MDQIEAMRKVVLLLEELDKAGYVLTINTEPLLPLAMGHHCNDITLSVKRGSLVNFSPLNVRAFRSKP